MPPPSGPSPLSYRDRTAEFFAVVERLRKNSGAANNGDVNHVRVNEKPSASTPVAGAAQSEFNRRASRIGLTIHQTSQKLDKLAKLAKRTSMFDDPAVEIQELTAVIKQDIEALKSAIDDLQRITDASDSGNRNKHTNDHSTTVVDNLKTRLMSTTKSFKDVLTLRTENLKVHENRRKMFTSNGDVGGPSSRLRSIATTSAPPPWATSNGGQTSSTSTAAQLFTERSSRRGFGVEKQGLLQGQQQQELVPAQDSYMASRAEALQNVETTIAELSNIFQNLAVMVQQQGEIAIRIDQDVDDSVTNVESAQAQLLKYFDRISSNRWLVIKIFFVLLLFLLIFVVFIA